MVCVSSVARSCPTLCDPMEPTRLLCPWNFPGKNTGGGCHFLHQGIFRLRDQTSVSYVSCISRWVLYHYCHLGSPLSHGDLVKRQLYNSGALGWGWKVSLWQAPRWRWCCWNTNAEQQSDRVWGWSFILQHSIPFVWTTSGVLSNTLSLLLLFEFSVSQWFSVNPDCTLETSGKLSKSLVPEMWNQNF